MTIENGNGELKQLLEIRRSYRKDLEEYQTELKAKYERELAAAKKQFKEKYLEKIVDTVFAENPSAPLEPTPEPAPAPTEGAGVRVIAGEPAIIPAPEKPRCPECDAPVDPMDKFCAECAYPLTEEVKHDASVPSTSRKLRTKRR